MITEICNYGDTGQQIVDVVLFDYSDIFEKVARYDKGNALATRHLLLLIYCLV
jgi:hypothetical protein